ncbi:MerR family transcriptional regulator [Streptomyces sp. NPDC003717]|uniref:MerR family transcriptional regulator n=1 Tax=Streptomyces sp. NPDC003717 TaxID=3154276 RepID=UPI0033A0CB22
MDRVITDGGTHTAEAGVTTGVLARRLGVSPTTIRSWDRRYGLGPAHREGGRHRRWRAADIAVLEEMCRLTATGVPPAEAARAAMAPTRPGTPTAPGAGDPAAPPPPTPAYPPDTVPAPHGRVVGSGLPLGDVRHEARGLARASVRLDSAAVQDLLNSFVREHGVLAAWEDVMMPTLHAVGRKWQSSGDRYVEVEHLLSWHVSTALRSAPLLRPCPVPPPETAPVLLACLPDEQHTLPLEALDAALRERGAATRMLGGAVPAEALTAAVRRSGPSAVVLWSQTRSTASVPLARELGRTQWGVQGARHGPAVLVAGPGWGRRGLPGLLRPHGLGDALAMLSGAGTTAPPARRPEETG